LTDRFYDAAREGDEKDAFTETGRQKGLERVGVEAAYK
jgi:hypothetical protein